MLLVKNVHIIEPTSKYHGKKVDLLIKKGKIDRIKARIQSDKYNVYDAKGACMSIGWMDIGVQVGDPGLEHREDLESVAKAAMAGGFTAIACYPNTNPSIHSKSEVLYIKNNTSDSLVRFYPIGAASRNCKGEEMTEIYDMHESGAVAFSDGTKSIQNSGLMMRTLQYVKAFGGLVMNHPHDKQVGNSGQMHEGLTSVNLGMKGIPSLAEELMTQRDIYLAEYTESKLHVLNISTARATNLIKQAKSKGIQVTTSVPAINLALDDSLVESFQARYKVLPPLREKSDIKALKRGLKNGTIDCITSNHIPWDGDAKNLEYSRAEFGSIGLETVFAICNTHLKSVLSLEALIEKLSRNPREILGIPVPKIEEGAIANLTLFDPLEEWTFTKEAIYSKSKNTPFIGTTFTGKVLGLINQKQSWFRS